MSAPTVVDLVTRAVLDRLQTEIGTRINEAVQATQETAQKQLDEFMRELIVTPLPGPAEADSIDPRADARNRAGRTAIQGAIATATVAALLAIAAVIGGGDFDVTSGGDWKAVAGAAIGAVVAAGAAYVQRIVSPPRGGAGE
ncbi:hypothetical protein [Nocardia cyriacigeorgica]|uniref:hypothetical protein n=1 Tax=Nocardia cyriacigeorgica TaxID=135487 RepID=UPI002454404B|nr:hypothetical protein [Nocardia cyriacigeorgica]